MQSDMTGKHSTWIVSLNVPACKFTSAVPKAPELQGSSTDPVAKKGGVGLLPSALCSPRIHNETS